MKPVDNIASALTPTACLPHGHVLEVAAAKILIHDRRKHPSAANASIIYSQTAFEQAEIPKLEFPSA